MELSSWQSLPSSFSLPSGLDVSVINNPAPQPPPAPPSRSLAATSAIDSHLLSAAAGGTLSSSIAAALLAPSLSELRQQSSRQRKYNFSFLEKELLVTLIEKHGDVVESRTGSAVTYEQKVHAWSDIESRFNERNGGLQMRSVSELKKCYWNLKQKTKKVLEACRDTGAAGGTMRVDRVLWRIAQLAPEQFEGLSDMHCELVNAPFEGELPIKEETYDVADMDMSRLESPGQSLDWPQHSPPSEVDLFPIPRDCLSVEMLAPQQTAASSSPVTPAAVQQQLQQLQQPAVVSRAQSTCAAQSLVSSAAPSSVGSPSAAPASAAAMCSVVPGLTALSGTPSLLPLSTTGASAGAVPQSLRERLCDGGSIVAGSGDRASPPVKRQAVSPSEDCEDSPAMQLRRQEHELRMRLLRQEAEFMFERHRLEMDVLENQRVFWNEALKRARASLTSAVDSDELVL